MFEILTALLTTLLLFLILEDRFYSLFFVVLLTTEFFYIEVGGGVLRPYHFLAIFVLLSLYKHMPALKKSRFVPFFSLFIAVNLVAVLLSSTPTGAFNSFLSLSVNIVVAMAIALILITRKVTVESFKRIILLVTLAGIGWGLVQIVVFRLTGIVLALSPEQLSQIQIGLAPVFRTEADTFGKYMVLPFMLFLPEYIEYKKMPSINLVFLIFVVGIFMNFIRVPIYGTIISIPFIYFWYRYKGQSSLFTKKATVATAIIVLGLVLMVTGALPVSEYSVHKINNMFSKEEVLEGGSSGYRLLMMGTVIDSALSSTKLLIIGNGWGQTYVDFNGEEIQAGGGDSINVLGSAGLLGVAAYLLYTFQSLFAACKTAKTCLDPAKARLAEGVAFAILGIFCSAQMAGYLITPEYWMLIGLSAYLGIDDRTIQHPIPCSVA